ncbi:hypothetical protein [Patulibacter sp. SYSU D01012]|uniref:hypothetical protein n=1 Tax=Patulibacter sp. SYSU D01012 TaxID=2817381 RepID=UPI001B31479D|nr:hypothetical protein [Patulibacter sp. SYSU D01012]
MPVDPLTITPTVVQVAALIRNRTINRLGKEVGTFDATTRPTLAEAEPLIARAARYVSISIGERFDDWPPALVETAKDAAASFAALYIEQGFYADGSNGDHTPADQLGRIAREQLGALLRDAGRGRLMRSIQLTDPADTRSDDDDLPWLSRSI